MYSISLTNVLNEELTESSTTVNISGRITSATDKGNGKSSMDGRSFCNPWYSLVSNLGSIL